MNIKTQIVIHESSGKGEVIEQTGVYFTVLFAHCKEMKFKYPDSFEKWLYAKDVALNDEIQKELTEIGDKKIVVEQEKELN